MPIIDAQKPLVRVVRIVDVQPIAKADSIELATVLGYDCCIAKNDSFVVGDLVLYFSIDSVPDSNEDTAFLNGQRIKIRKMMGVVSEGLIAPLKWACRFGVEPSTLAEGDDLTEIMRVKQWIADEEEDSHAPASGDNAAGLLGTVIPKTHQDRIQEQPRALHQLQSAEEVFVTLKMDGCSATFAWVDNKLLSYARNVEVTNLSGKNFSHYHRWSSANDIAERLKALGKEIAIQGELCGKSINGGRTGITTLEYFVFHVWSMKERRYLDWDEMVAVVEALHLQTVPLLHRGAGLPIAAGDTMQSLLAWVDRQRYASGMQAEGVVISTKSTERIRRSYKAVSPKYLLSSVSVKSGK